MSSNVAGPEIERLIQLLARLPGSGPRSARRAALHLIRKRETLLQPLAEAMRVAEERIVACSVCGTVDSRDPCTICSDEQRDPSTIVVVESVGDLWALERAGALRARYHVLGGVLSPLDGVGPADLNLTSLVARVAAGGVGEVILAVNATVDGQTTAHYIVDLSRRLSGQGDAPRPRRSGRGRTRLSRRRHARRRHAPEDGVLACRRKKAAPPLSRSARGRLDLASERLAEAISMSAAFQRNPALRSPLSAAVGKAARRAVDHSHPAAQSARDLGQGGFRAAVLDRPLDPRPARRRPRSGRGAPRLPRQRGQLPQGRPAAEGAEPGPRQRPADGRGRVVAAAAPLARAAVFAAPGRRIRARHAEGSPRRRSSGSAAAATAR